jgi:hypothetical protein
MMSVNMLSAENTINCTLPLLQVPAPSLVYVHLKCTGLLTRIRNHLPVELEGMTFNECNDEGNNECNA